ncbi:uncharacterized protein [Venturia canescens]|uniref:uncharacterized protein isoform X2 n=1 Tax=Venturia canescens TaxID=32260 RepID=UPI001C9C3339|nr:uncharacterized protein LOC122407472 isoform X2 [Venturia canescens]
MGRAFRASGPASGRSGEHTKKITQVKIKKKKRKRDLEELHQNVLEAKRAAVEENEAKDAKSRKKKSKKICDRLLPEPMLGMYENGAKGREICRVAGRLNGMSDARLRGNVLELLKGDETNPDARRRNKEGMRSTKVQGKPMIGGKDEPTELPRQRDEDKCKRRLFEPDDEDEPTKNSFDAIDRAMITDHEIRFSPSRAKDVADSKERNILGYDREKRTIPRDPGSQNVRDGSRARRAVNKNLIDDRLWSWSPATSYERLCAMISIDNFENSEYNWHTDPIPKIQTAITEIFLRNVLRGSRDASKEPRESSSTTALEKSIITSNGEDVIYQACTQDSDMDQCSSTNSSTTKIGSWHPLDKQGRTTVFEKKNVKGLKRTRGSQKMEEDSSTKDKNERNDLSSSPDVVQKTINSVSEFLEQFHKHNPVRRKDKNGFETDIDKGKRTSGSGEKLHVCLDSPPRDVQSSDTSKCIPRRNTTKHVPTILRRSSEHCGSVESMDHEENTCEFFIPKPAGRRILKEHIGNDENSIFSNHNPFSPSERVIRSTGHMTISPCAASVLREPNYYHYRTPARERSKELAEHRQLDRANDHKSKFNFMRTKYNSNPRLSWSEELEVKPSQEDGYEEGLSDRKIEGTSRDFMEVVNVRSNTHRNRTLCENQQGVMDFQMDLADQSESDVAEEEIGGKRVAFFRDSDRFFNANDRDNVEVFEAGFQQRKNHQNPGIKARKTLSNFPRSAHHDSPRKSMRFSSFEFRRSDTERASHRFNEPSNEPQEQNHPVFHDGNTAESFTRVENEDFANKPASQFFLADKHESAAWRYADTQSWLYKQAVQGHASSEPSKNPQRHYENPRPSDRSSNGFVAAGEPRGIMRKPVVLFRPIEEVGQKFMLQNRNSRYRHNPDSNVMRAAVKNLREIAFEDKSKKHPPRESDDANYERKRRRVSPSPRDQQLTVNPSNQLFYESLCSFTQPAKFLAYETVEGSDPRRIPIFENDIPNVPADNNKRGASELQIIDERSENSGAGHRRFIEVARPVEEQENRDNQRVVQQLGGVILAADQNYLTSLNNDESTFLSSSGLELGRTERQRSRRIAVMVPLPASSHYHPTSKLLPATEIDSRPSAAAPDDRERASRPGQFRFEVESSAPLPVNANREQDQSRYEMNVEFVGAPEATDLPERIQLPDGRIGILLAHNHRPIGNSSQLYHSKHTRTINDPCSLGEPTLHAENRCVYGFNENDPNVYSQLNFQRNVGYGANEAYHRPTRANGAPDTFTGI